MMSPQKAEGRLWVEFNSIASSLRAANTHFYIGRKLVETRPTLAREFDKSRDFWGYTIGAHIQATNFHLCRIYDDHSDDKRGRTHHLLRFVNEIDEAVLTEAQKRERLADLDFLQRENRVGTKQPDCDVAKLRTWRKKLIAHTDYDLATDGLDAFLKNHPLDFPQIQKLIDVGFAILKRWAAYYHFRGELKKISEFKDDYQFVLESVRLRFIKESPD